MLLVVEETKLALCSSGSIFIPRYWPSMRLKLPCRPILKHLQMKGPLRFLLHGGVSCKTDGSVPISSHGAQFSPSDCNVIRGPVPIGGGCMMCGKTNSIQTELCIRHSEGSSLQLCLVCHPCRTLMARAIPENVSSDTCLKEIFRTAEHAPVCPSGSSRNRKAGWYTNTADSMHHFY